jgi:hypothetical protein
LSLVTAFDRLVHLRCETGVSDSLDYQLQFVLACVRSNAGGEVDRANRLGHEVSRLHDSKGPSPGQIQHSREPQPEGIAGSGVGVGVVGSAAGFLAFEAFFFSDFLAAGFFAVDFFADLAPFFFEDFLAAFFFLAIANDSFTSKRPSHSGRLPRGRYRTGKTIVVANGVCGDAALVVRAGIVSSLDESSQGESALISHVRLGARGRTVASASE